MRRTISGMVGEGSLSHNNRDFIAENIDRSRTANNIIYKNINLKTVYIELFGAALERYNAKQKRNDRKIMDYYEHIRNGKQEKLFHEVIFQIGNVKDTAVGTAEGDQAKMVLNKFMKSFEKRNPSLHVFSAHLHMDEATPHLHIDFVPYTTGSERGLDTRVSMKKALATQGFEGGRRGDTEYNQWINAEKQALAQVMERHGIEWDKLDTHNEHLSVLDFKKKERLDEVKTLGKSIIKLHQQQADIQAVENIMPLRVPLSSKVMVEREDFEKLALAAKKYVVQEKQERRFQKLLDTANQNINTLKSKVAYLEKDLKGYKSIKGQISMSKLQHENDILREQNERYQSVLREKGLLQFQERKQNIKETINSR